MRKLALDIPNRAPFPAFAVALMLAVFAIVGLAFLDDYGVTLDEPIQRQIGLSSLDFVLGDEDALPKDHNRFYGVAVEVPLALAERLLGLTDSRDIFLGRHLLSHLLFLAGGLFCSLLVHRLFGSRLLALFALLLFLLHPRLYGHSFVNTKDLPFLSMFMIELYLIDRAFRRDTLGAFALCGLGAGLFSNIRIMGVMLLVAVLALRACDLLQAPAGKERKHVLTTGGGFLLAGALMLYASFPYLWSNPLRILQGLIVLSQHPEIVDTRFQGELVRWPDIPAHYIPTWIAITTPPVVLLLGLVGMACTLRDLIRRPAEALRNTGLRFKCLLLGCLAVPIAAVILLNANIYESWRHLYFLYAPMALLAVFGLRWLASAGRRRSVHGRWMAVHAFAAAGVAVTLVEMALIHPYQTSYFNLLVDRHTPEYLRTQYRMPYWDIQYWEGLEHLLERHPSSPVLIALRPESALQWHRLMLPDADRRRTFTADKMQRSGPHFVMESQSSRAVQHGSLIHSRRLYNNTILRVMAVDPPAADQAPADAWREAYWSKLSGKPAAEADFDLYLDGNRLTYIKQACTQQDIENRFFLHVHPVRREDLPETRRYSGFDNLDFSFSVHGALFDGKCLASVPLPEDYAIASLRTGQFVDLKGEIWAVEIRLRSKPPPGQYKP